MKLYAFQPNGHGELSAFVMAEDEVSAKQAVINAAKEEGIYNISGFGTDYYITTVVGPLTVVWNDNS